MSTWHFVHVIYLLRYISKAILNLVFLSLFHTAFAIKNASTFMWTAINLNASRYIFRKPKMRFRKYCSGDKYLVRYVCALIYVHFCFPSLRKRNCSARKDGSFYGMANVTSTLKTSRRRQNFTWIHISRNKSLGRMVKIYYLPFSFEIPSQTPCKKIVYLMCNGKYLFAAFSKIAKLPPPPFQTR